MLTHGFLPLFSPHARARGLAQTSSSVSTIREPTGSSEAETPYTESTGGFTHPLLLCSRIGTSQHAPIPCEPACVKTVPGRRRHGASGRGLACLEPHTGDAPGHHDTGCLGRLHTASTARASPCPSPSRGRRATAMLSPVPSYGVWYSAHPIGAPRWCVHTGPIEGFQAFLADHGFCATAHNRVGAHKGT